MPDVFMWVDKEMGDNPDFVADAQLTATKVVCDQPGVTIDHSGCWPRIIPTIGTPNITIQFVAHYSDGDGRTEQWEHKVAAGLAPAIGAVVEKHYPGRKIGVSVDSTRLPFGPAASYYKTKDDSSP